MRLAEEKYPKKSAILWNDLRKAIQKKAGDQVNIETKTLTGFEEGIYAWLTARESQQDNQFGLIEMGGASLQIIFPCSTCKETTTIQVDDQPIHFFGTSLLGSGPTEAYKLLEKKSACHQQAGVNNSEWKPEDCLALKLNQRNSQTLTDQYNYRGKPVSQKQSITIPLTKNTSLRWLLQGAFHNSPPSDIAKCCQTKSLCSRPETSCFQPIYIQYILNILGIDYQTAIKGNNSWTLGAAICNSTDCMQTNKQPNT